MSENLYIALFMFSGWFLLESYNTSRKSWDFLAGFSIFYLFFTRSIGVVAIIGFLMSLVPALLKKVLQWKKPLVVIGMYM